MKSTNRSTDLVICGIGNRSRGDDAAGLEAASLLAKNLGASCRVFICDAGPERYIDEIREIRPDRILVIDAAELGGKPGTWRRIEPGEIDDRAISTHSIGLPFFHHLLSDFCERVELYGIQAKEVGYSNEISDEVRGGIDELVSWLSDMLATE